MAAHPRKHIVIIGGGASGVLLACELLRHRGRQLAVTLIEKRHAVGRGTAYSTDNADHLLNVRAFNMSAFAHDPKSFTRWLTDNGEIVGGREPGPLTFVPRKVYGRYLESLIASYLASVAGPPRLSIVHAEARRVRESADGIVVETSGGGHIQADAAVFAGGHDETPPANLACVTGPWEPRATASVGSKAAILVLGTGLTMVDYTIALRAAGHTGPIYALSRRGQLPQLHRPTMPIEINRANVPFGQSMVAIWTWFRAIARAQKKSGGDWRSAVDALRPHVSETWRRMPFDDRQRFLRHARPWWDSHRHRMAPRVADEITRARTSGQLRILAANIEHITGADSGAVVSFRRRGRHEIETIEVARIVMCTGVVSDPRTSSNPIVAGLLADRLARPDPLSIGLHFDTNSALVSADGRPSTRIFGIGPVTRAAFWEIVAVPDIREQCVGLSHHLAVMLKLDDDLSLAS